ncbi:hypothetical protein FIV42_04580 [Persicimonas caeni]|uniref:Uncharacterized protein n=1 Tax=Persicimonas caeni TaxID=2292766 RepID=A0A4Y6PNY4_PERCE|nr:hypothetical protein [Persicimonas caeni]QDG50038.1 hypothetical protein FIV42_04580 [Persicimonas caeni]QED31259.1 hypothetical protein FRD00_04575 [Persicimonas caeni]
MRVVPPMCRTIVLVAVAAFLLPTLLPTRAEAQECESEALDALARARRVRSFQLDFSRYRRDLDTRFDRLYRWLEDGGEDVEWSTQFSWLGDNYKFSDYALCTAQGERAAQLNGGWNGFALETRNRKWDVRLRLMLFDAGDGVSPDDLPRDDNGDVIFDDDAVGYGQLFYGVYLQVTEWFGVTVGGVSDSQRLQHIGTTTTDEGDVKTSTRIQTNTVGEPGWYLSASIPKWKLSTDFIFGAADSVDVGMLRAASIPMPFVDGLEALAGGGYLGYEDTTVGYLGARYRPVSFVETTLELAVEPVRVRSVRGRAEVDWSHPFYPELELLPGQPSKWLVGAEAGAFVEASLFNSAYLEAQEGRSNVTGLLGGASLGVIARPVGFNFEVYGGVNPAAHLARIVDVVDKPLFGTRLMVRTGW